MGNTSLSRPIKFAIVITSFFRLSFSRLKCIAEFWPRMSSCRAVCLRVSQATLSIVCQIFTSAIKQRPFWFWTILSWKSITPSFLSFTLMFSSFLRQTCRLVSKILLRMFKFFDIAPLVMFSASFAFSLGRPLLPQFQTIFKYKKPSSKPRTTRMSSNIRSLTYQMPYRTPLLTAFSSYFLFRHSFPFLLPYITPPPAGPSSAFFMLSFWPPLSFSYIYTSMSSLHIS